MKIIKSDRRYKFYRSGFEHILEFRTTRADVANYQSVLLGIEQTYGPYLSYNWEVSTQPKINEKFKVDYSMKLKRRRIYLKTEQEVSLFLLKSQINLPA